MAIQQSTMRELALFAGAGGGILGGSAAQSTELNSHRSWWGSDPADDPESRLGRMAHGVANRVDRLKAIGNGQVPLVAATAWRILND